MGIMEYLHESVRRLAATLAVVFLALLLTPRVAQAGGVVGTGTPASCNELTLSAALAGGGIVTFNCGSAAHTIGSFNQKVIAANTQVDGGGLITLSGRNTTRIFNVNSGVTLTLLNLILENGLASGEQGGAILNNGTLVVVNSAFINNDAGTHGGAIGNYGTLQVSNSTFTNNTASINGGAIDTTVMATITNSLFMSNTAGFRGGGVNNYLGVLNILEGRFIDNTGNTYGGGVTNDAGTLNLTRSQFSGNTSGDFGGGLRNSGSASIFDSHVSSSQSLLE